MGENTAADTTESGAVEAFIGRWRGSGGAETANAQSFLSELCELLDLPKPDPAQEQNALNDYVFERRVTRHHADGRTSPREIDLYRRGCFVLEAKQGSAGQARKADAAQAEMFGEAAGEYKAGTARRGTQGWITAMRAAREQAERYAKDLPGDHGWPPFVIVCDVGYCFELFADFSGLGKHYAQFPDRRGFRVMLEDLRKREVRERLRAIWTEPASLDPSAESARVTRDIAERLARVARELEKSHDAEAVAHFLMRCLFTMFAEDVELLKKNSFTAMLESFKGRADKAHLGLEQVWKDMDSGSALSARLDAPVRRFNGGLFKETSALPLTEEMLAELIVAARKDWRDVEPAIFGTLLEQALKPKERSKLGAHYTPRSYVERLVTPAVIEPLREDWRDVQAQCRALLDAGEDREALRAARAFHEKLCATRVLDPACGTGNFLYVAMELMKRLEGDVVDFIVEMGGKAAPEYREHSVGPRQFLGVEINPRAAAITELVLWIGYIKWQIRQGGLDFLHDPVLEDFGNIDCRDAVLAYDDRTLRTDENGRPVTRWDGETYKPHPVTGEDVPDETARMEIYDYAAPRPADWPEAEFIVGNPPFIGKGGLRSELGDGYAEALWAAYPKMPGSADFVMYWWDKAAERLRAGAAKKQGEARIPRRFGFITTNSIRQTFNRRVLERHMTGKSALSLAYAVPDHPWLKSADKAAVRIAMTVAEPGAEQKGLLAGTVHEAGLNTDRPEVRLEAREGVITPALRLGAAVSSATPLKANKGVCANGVALHGRGFEITPQQAATMFQNYPNIQAWAVRYVKGGDLTSRLKHRYVLDFEGLSENEVRDKYPDAFQHLYDSVKPERDQNNDPARKRLWYLFGRRHTTLRESLVGVTRVICTTETSKHRHFQFIDMPVRPDHMVVCVSLDESSSLAVLSSRIHAVWALAAGGTLEDRPRYNKTRCFDPFPFPDLTDKPALAAKLDELGEKLDSFLKERLAEHKQLTMTRLYNVLERVRGLEAPPSSAEQDGSDTDPHPNPSGARTSPVNGGQVRSRSGAIIPPPPAGGELANDREAVEGGAAQAAPLTAAEKDIYEAGLVGVLKAIHDEIDDCVAEAYGWEAHLSEEAVLEKLVALNAARAKEEAEGNVRWLRPDYQAPRFAPETAAEQAEMEVPEAAKAAAAPRFPKSKAEQARALRDVLAAAGEPVAPEAAAALFWRKPGKASVAKVEEMLEVLAAIGQAERDAASGGYFSGR